MTELSLTSAAFEHERGLPARHTCDGEGLSPPLDWRPGPSGTRGYALLMEDLDPPGPTTHWLVWNLGMNALAEGAARDPGLRQARGGYLPPCPPTGEHRYFFTVYALGDDLELPDEATRDDLLAAIDGLVLARGELIARYARRPVPG